MYPSYFGVLFLKKTSASHGKTMRRFCFFSRATKEAAPVRADIWRTSSWQTAGKRLGDAAQHILGKQVIKSL